MKENKKQFSFFPNIGMGEEKKVFIENLGILVNSGIGISEALGIISNETRSKRMREVIAEMQSKVEQGTPLWQTFRNANFFNESTISLIKMGEQSGQLGANLGAIAVQQQKDRVALSKIQNAMAYPVLVLFITFIVAIGIFWFILPKLQPVFTDLNVELPTITKIFIAFSAFLVHYGLVFVPILIIFVLIVGYFIFYYSESKFIGQAILFLIPGIRKMITEVEVSRFGYVLGNLLSAGVPLNDSLEALYESTNLVAYQRLYYVLKKNIEEGYSLQKSFLRFPEARKLFPGTIMQMIIVGEQSGNLSGVLKNIGEVFENKSENTIRNLTTALEPIMLILVWFGVMAVALSVILPIYSLIGGLNNQISPVTPVVHTISR